MGWWYNNSMQIRKAEPEDAVGIAKVVELASLNYLPNEELGIKKEDVSLMIKEQFSDAKIIFSKEQIKNLPNNKVRIVALIDDQIIGVCYLKKDDTYNHITALYVLPEYQGEGVGKSLFAEILKYTDKNKNIAVSTESYNTKAIKFYENLGFEKTGNERSVKINEHLSLPTIDLIKVI